MENDYRNGAKELIFHIFLQVDDEVSFKDDIKTIVSVGQFRPEKDHALQIRAMFELRELLSAEKWNKIKLVLIGGCRNEEDEKRVNDLKDLCKHFSIENNVEFRLNVPFEELCQAMQKASIGLHSMWNEHFGITVVEMLAAGLITIAHRLVDYLFFNFLSTYHITVIHVKVVLSQKILDNFSIANIDIPNHYPELKI